MERSENIHEAIHPEKSRLITKPVGRDMTKLIKEVPVGQWYSLYLAFSHKKIILYTHRSYTYIDGIDNKHQSSVAIT